MNIFSPFFRRYWLLSMLILPAALFQHAFSQNFTSEALGFNVFVENDMTFGGGDVEGGVAIGNNLNLPSGAGQFAIHSPGTYAVSGISGYTGLLVGNQVVMTNGGLNLLSQAGLRIGNGLGLVAFDSQNGSNANTRIVKSGGNFDSNPRISMDHHQAATSVFGAIPVDFSAAFTTFRSRSTAVSACTPTVQITNANGNPLNPAALGSNTQVYIQSLATGENILNLTGANLNNIQNITFNTQPSATKHLIINVDASGTFNWSNFTFAGVGSQNAPYVLINFYNSTTVNINNSNSVYATIFAPFASVSKNNSANIDGQVIAKNFTMMQYGEVHKWYFQPGIPSCAAPVVCTANAGLDKVLTCTTSSVTLDGSSAASGVTYSWSGPSGFTSGAQNPSVSAAGTYTLTVTTSGCSSSDQVVVTSSTALPNASATGATITCASPSVQIFGSSTTPGVTYAWSGPSGFTSSTQSPMVTAAGTYTLTVTTTATGCSKTATAVVNNNSATVGDFVFNDLNGNGIQDSGEPGVGGVEVKLYICNPTTGVPSAPGAAGAYATTTTTSNGAYLFTCVDPGQSYYVEVGTGVPSGFDFTLQAAGTNPATDSNVNGLGQTGCFPVNPNDNITTIDIGIVELASLGDKVFYDLDGDGQQDAGESGVVGVTVKLYVCGSTTPIATETTDTNGNYLFEDLTPNTSYYVVFSNIPSGYEFSVSDQGADATDSDANANGATGCYLLDPGENELTVDAGIKVSVCEADAGTLTIDCPSGTFCRQFGKATVLAAADGNAFVPAGFSIAYLFARQVGSDLIVEQVGTSPSFIATQNGDYSIHTLVYDGNAASANYLDLSSISLGIDKISEVFTMLKPGGGSLCGDLDVAGALGIVIKCQDPRANNDFVNTLVNTTATGNVKTNDVNPYGHPLALYVINGAKHGTLTINQAGDFTYIPNPGFIGEDSARYKLRDTTICNHLNGYGWIYFEVIAIPQPAINDVPIANADMVTTRVGVPVTIFVLANDLEPDGETVVLSPYAAPDSGAVVYNLDRTVTYTPDPGIVGEDYFTYEICDGNGDCDMGRVRIMILDVPGVKFPPISIDDALMILVNNSGEGEVISNDYELDGDQVVLSVVSGPSHGDLLSFDTSTGEYLYQPDPNFTGTDMFTYQSTDSEGSSTATVQIMVTGGVTTFPVEWVGINAELRGADGVVLWSTASEMNASHYEIERSFEGSMFERMGTVAAAGNTTSLTSYEFTDRNLSAADWSTSAYYRIRQVDIDGTFSYSKTVELSFEANDILGLRVYPSPTNRNLQVSWHQPIGPVEIEIYDQLGREVMKTLWSKDESFASFDVSELKSGVYHLKLSSQDKVEVSSFIKQE
ncbi:MAG: choice-of-anchor A family protein [Bacteroidia bacterium]|nr:choice-of-anchor A family protein [Bacteroidia bacterium]